MENKMPSITVLILTYNEEQHITRVMDSVSSLASQIVIVDSFSTDRTVELAKERGGIILQNKWRNNYSHQFNWGLDNAPINGEWVMRLDADEYITPELVLEIRSNLSKIPSSVSGIYMRRRIYFMGKWMKYGGTYPMWMLRLWRNGHGRCENRWMDEHIVLNQGDSVRFDHDFVDDNLNDLTWWTAKHNNYATREAADLLNQKYSFMKMDSCDTVDKEQAMVKRWIKENIYFRIPLFIRPFIYFIYRYFFKWGFLDGSRGLQWAILQGFWYRFLVDAKIFEAERFASIAKDRGVAVKEFVLNRWGLAPPSE